MPIRLFVEWQLNSGVVVEMSLHHAHYLYGVMRVSVGEIIHLFNGADGEWRARIYSATKRSVFLEILELFHPQEIMKPLYLGFAPIKNIDANFIVQKATELGVTKIFPIITERTIVKTVNMMRLQKAAIEASEQCGRLSIPEILPAQSLRKFLIDYGKQLQVILCDEQATAHDHIIYAKDKLNASDPILLIGPEGGFSEIERNAIKSNKDTIFIQLGPRILRAETAAISALSAYQVLYGDWK